MQIKENWNLSTKQHSGFNLFQIRDLCDTDAVLLPTY